ncbi:unnamed protein product [Heterosigma akashiwo]
MVLVRKPDSSWRCCVDFRRLNQITKKDRFPLPLTNDVIRQLSSAKFFTSVDMYKGYWQVPLHEEDIEKTAFNTPFGLYEWMYMPMGLWNSGATYQAMMNEVLQEFLGVCVCVYLGDVFIYSNSESDHVRDVQRVMTALMRAGLKTRPDKTCLFRASCKCLGFYIEPDGIRPIGEKINAIRDVQVPKTKKGIQRFLGMCRYYERFVSKLAHLALPLTTLLKKGV